MYTADFETEVSLKTSTYVWAWALCDIKTEEITRGLTIDSFIKEAVKKVYDIIYFHNLKFDGSFIIDYLLRNGWEHTEERKCAVGEKKFTTLITDTGMFYSIEIFLPTPNKKKLRSVKFYDSMKKIAFSVADIAESFDLPIKKGEIDYKKYHPIGYEPTDEEWDYIENDVKIVAKALKYLLDDGHSKMTISADAMAYFKTTVKAKNIKWEYQFPILCKEHDEFVRRSYKGGFTYLNPKFQNIDVKEGICYDVNSMYPWAMRYNKLPYGKPVAFTGEYVHDDLYPLYIISFHAKFKLKENMIPTLQVKGSIYHPENEYITESDIDGDTLYLTSVDFELFKECYEIDEIEYFGGLKFGCATGIFNEYIATFMKIKAKEKGAKRTIAKLFLNGLYGKFGSNPLRGKKIPYLDENGDVKYQLGKKKETDPVYTAVASFVTSYCRDRIIRSAMAVYDRFIYADTDSLHLVGVEEPDTIEIHPSNLGAWKEEYKITKGKFIRQKTYMEEIENKEIVKRICGCPDKAKENISFDNFEEGVTVDGKLMPQRVKGGVILVDTKFTIKLDI